MVLKYCLASFQADSTASEPLVVKNTRFRSPGESPASRSASSIARGCAYDQSGKYASSLPWRAPRGDAGKAGRPPARAARPSPRLGDFLPAVPDLADEQPGQAVQVAPA